MKTKAERMRLNGCDFLWRESPKGGYAVFVRKSQEGERRFIGRKRSSRDAESFALTWAHVEAIRDKRGAPSQLRRKSLKRVRVAEEE